MTKIPETESSLWWRGCAIYQIYPRSFFDSNHDGIGDLAGITAKLDYLASLNIDAIWLSPIFTSPMKDFGYDVADYCNIDPIFGSLHDFDVLVKEAHARGLKVLMDHVVNHTSDQHPWFVESRSGLSNPKHDWYIWSDPKEDGTVPNNWLSVFGGAAWSWDSRRKQYYLHNFLSSQPDLNFHNSDVIEAVLSTFRFWLDRGVDGFRLDTANYYFHDNELRNNPPIKRIAEGSIGVRLDNPYSYQSHIYDKSRPENLLFLKRLRSMLDEYPNITTVGEIGCDRGLDTMAEYTSGGDKLHMAYTFDLLSEQSSASFIKETVEAVEDKIQDGWPCWSVGNHDVQRVASRWHQSHLSEHSVNQRSKIYAVLLSCLRGSICIYQGEELGLPEAELDYEDLVDPYGINFWPEYKGRDGCRTPIPWSYHQEHGGFSQYKPWLPVSDDHKVKSVSVQEKLSDSILNAYREIMQWRKNFSELCIGDIQFKLPLTNDLDFNPEEVLSFVRSYRHLQLCVVLNLSESEQRVTVNTDCLESSDLSVFHENLLPECFEKGYFSDGVLILPPWSGYVGRLEQV